MFCPSTCQYFYIFLILRPNWYNKLAFVLKLESIKKIQLFTEIIQVQNGLIIHWEVGKIPPGVYLSLWRVLPRSLLSKMLKIISLAALEGKLHALIRIFFRRAFATGVYTLTRNRSSPKMNGFSNFQLPVPVFDHYRYNGFTKYPRKSLDQGKGSFVLSITY